MRRKRVTAGNDNVVFVVLFGIVVLFGFVNLLGFVNRLGIVRVFGHFGGGGLLRAARTSNGPAALLRNRLGLRLFEGIDSLAEGFFARLFRGGAVTASSSTLLCVVSRLRFGGASDFGAFRYFELWVASKYRMLEFDIEAYDVVGKLAPNIKNGRARRFGRRDDPFYLTPNAPAPTAPRTLVTNLLPDHKLLNYKYTSLEILMEELQA
ncbi:hypothetical protein B0T24DRAFT_598290 [Lasiosphaeria ovina]|uniref:Uncharacterized protein n=1 Tax=Lasiosphaeria ovina TaxID=92902 RepID=A0AAE0JVT1_9PEZI|nr:hypothetical protein B0T24DRAFT_598290 [Lasiosphaeria ovina]